MESNVDQKVKLPKSREIRNTSSWYAQQRQKNFRDIIFETKLIEFYQMSPWCNDEPNSFGIQWFSGIQTPSALFSYPEQAYWQTHSLILMFGSKRFGVTIRGIKMPFKNFDSYIQWRKRRRNSDN